MSLPARYYVALLQTIFLAGDIWAVILPNMAVLARHGRRVGAADAPGNAEDAWLEATICSKRFSASSR